MKRKYSVKAVEKMYKGVEELIRLEKELEEGAGDEEKKDEEAPAEETPGEDAPAEEAPA